jgi:hypothetical protein
LFLSVSISFSFSIYLFNDLIIKISKKTLVMIAKMAAQTTAQLFLKELRTVVNQGLRGQVPNMSVVIADDKAQDGALVSSFPPNSIGEK